MLSRSVSKWHWMCPCPDQEATLSRAESSLQDTFLLEEGNLRMQAAASIADVE